MRLLNPIRRWFYRLHLGLIHAELLDVADDMADAKKVSDWGLYASLAEFRTDLLVEASTLRRKLAAIH